MKTRLSRLLMILPVLAPVMAHAAQPKRDLADASVGTYRGDIVSDARGSSQSDVTITVTKNAPNSVTVHSSSARIPNRTFRLMRAMQTIQNAGGTEVFLLDNSKSPPSLDLTIDDASWSGTKSPAD
jgi:hypothetical protein